MMQTWNIYISSSHIALLFLTSFLSFYFHLHIHSFSFSLVSHSHFLSNFISALASVIRYEVNECFVIAFLFTKTINMFLIGEQVTTFAIFASCEVIALRLFCHLISCAIKQIIGRDVSVSLRFFLFSVVFFSFLSCRFILCCSFICFISLVFSLRRLWLASIPYLWNSALRLLSSLN